VLASRGIWIGLLGRYPDISIVSESLQLILLSASIWSNGGVMKKTGNIVAVGLLVLSLCAGMAHAQEMEVGHSGM
jgi:hypothetical protein